MAIHGGDIYRNQVHMDFSVNSNPLGMPDEVKDALLLAAECCGNYPDPEVLELKREVCASLGLSPECLLFGNGASELFMAVVHGIRPQRVAIPIPSFYGYEYAARAVTEEICYAPFPKEGETWRDFLEKSQADLIFVGNPNNPTGTQLGTEELEELLEACRRHNCYLVLDECFMEFCREDSTMLGQLDSYRRLLVVRAYTKSFGIPGVRLGYLACSDRDLLNRIRQQLPEWNVSVFAQAAGRACEKNRNYLDKTVEYVEKERIFLRQGLETLGINVFEGKANFLLLYSEVPLYELLLRKGILIRDCSNFRGLGEGYYRVAVRTREENVKFLKEAGECIAAYRASQTGGN